MKITIIGLGLMGGSLAYALAGFKNSIITGADTNENTRRLALEKGAVKEVFDEPRDAVKDADIVIFCTPPEAILTAFDELKNDFKPGATVTEICGVKRQIAKKAAETLPKNVTYIGIHPMAGKEVWGFENADPAIFKNCGMIITPDENSTEAAEKTMRELALHIGAARIAVAPPGEHDRIIAYTSDLMHASASALCADLPDGFDLAFTAGAFRDCTRVAHLDPNLWTQLFLENADMLTLAIEHHINNLETLKKAIKTEDRDELFTLLTKTSQTKKGLIK